MAADLAVPTLGELLRLHGGIGDELIRRGVVRTGNNPCADLAETLFCRSFGWAHEPNSKKAYDALAPGGVRIQVKARRVTPRNASRQSGTLRKLEDGGFDRLAGLVFDAGYRVLLAFEMPHALVRELARYSDHVKGSALHMRDDLLALRGVVDHTPRLRTAAEALLAGYC